MFYHLENYHKECLVNCINNCNILFFETCVYDIPSSELIPNNESGTTQSISNRAKIPTSQWVENVLLEQNVSWNKILDGRLNGGGHHYDWSDGYYNGLSRRFWVINGKL